jgi:hypothetical protein
MTERAKPPGDGRSSEDASLVADLAAGRSTADLAVETGLTRASGALGQRVAFRVPVRRREAAWAPRPLKPKP